jgi:hypothetical protein
MWIGLAVIALILGAVLYARNASKMKYEARQYALGELIVAILAESKKPQGLPRMERGKDGELKVLPSNGPRIFVLAWPDVRQFLRENYPQLGDFQRRVRLAHAISLVEDRISPEDRDLLRHMEKGYFGD